MKVVIIKEDGIITSESFLGKTIGLEYLQEKVGGYIELASRKIGNKWYDLYIDEEGRLKDLPTTLITQHEDFKGTVVVTQSKGDKTIPLTIDEAIEVISVLNVFNMYFGSVAKDVVITKEFNY